MRVLSIVPWLVVAGFATGAVAQPKPTDAELKADALFQEGRRLLDAGDAPAACPKFEESQRLDPGLGTLLNLADCYERTGRFASALTAFRGAEEQARALGEKKREAAAADRARALEGKASRLTIQLATGDRPAGFEVRRGGAVVAALDFGRPIAVDPGTIAIEANAPGHEPFRTSVAIGAGRSAERIEIPVLAPSTAVAPPPPDPDPIDVPGQPVRTVVDPGAGRRRLAFIVGGVGLASLGGGIGLGLVANAKYPDACAKAGDCSKAEVDKADSARRLGNIGTIVGGVGVAALVAGTVLYMTAPKAHAVEVAPVVGSDGAGVTFLGRF